MDKAYVSYTDSRGNIFDLMVDDSKRIQTANFHEYSWDKDVIESQFGEKLKAWKKDALNLEVTIIFDGLDREKDLNDFHDALEYDIFNNSPGRLRWGSETNNYYIDCYGISSKTYPTEEKTNTSTSNDVTFYCPSPWWKKETVLSSFSRFSLEEQKVYIVPSATPFSSGWLSTTDGGEAFTPVSGMIYKIQSEGDYQNHKVYWNDSTYVDITPEYGKTYDMAYDYAYDYDVDYDTYLSIYNDNILGSSFVMVITGPATNPIVKISNNNGYDEVNVGINTEVSAGGILIIDSTDKTVTKVNADGTTENCFGARNLETGYLWNKVPPGTSFVSWDGTFDFVIKLIEERSEPKWLSD